VGADYKEQPHPDLLALTDHRGSLALGLLEVLVSHFGFGNVDVVAMIAASHPLHTHIRSN
jgi:hypothetical protein